MTVSGKVIDKCTSCGKLEVVSIATRKCVGCKMQDAKRPAAGRGVNVDVYGVAS